VAKLPDALLTQWNADRRQRDSRISTPIFAAA
jgi:hypothetical protein